MNTHTHTHIYIHVHVHIHIQIYIYIYICTYAARPSALRKVSENSALGEKKKIIVAPGRRAGSKNVYIYI